MTKRKERQSDYMTFSHIDRARKNSNDLIAIFNRVKDDDEYRIVPPRAIHFRTNKRKGIVAIYPYQMDDFSEKCKKIGIIPDEFKKAKVALAAFEKVAAAAELEEERIQYSLLCVRITSDQYARLKREAGDMTLSDYVRSRLLDVDQPSQAAPKTELQL